MKLYHDLLIIDENQNVYSLMLLTEDDSKSEQETFLDKLLNKLKKEAPEEFESLAKSVNVDTTTLAELKQAVNKKNVFVKIVFFLKVIAKWLKVTIWGNIKKLIKKFWDWFKDLPGVKTVVEKIASWLKKNENEKASFVIGGIEFTWKEVAVGSAFAFILGGIVGQLIKRVKKVVATKESIEPKILLLRETDLGSEKKRFKLLGKLPDALYALINVLKDIKDAAYKMIISGIAVVFASFILMAVLALLKKPLCALANRLVKSNSKIFQTLGNFIISTMEFIDDKLKCKGSFKCATS